MGRPKIHANKSAANKKYCDTYRAKNLTKLREKEKQRKTEARDYEKYVDREKHQERLKKDRQRAREYCKQKKSEKQQADELQTQQQQTPSASIRSSTPQESTSVFNTTGIESKRDSS